MNILMKLMNLFRPRIEILWSVAGNDMYVLGTQSTFWGFKRKHTDSGNMYGILQQVQADKDKTLGGINDEY